MAKLPNYSAETTARIISDYEAGVSIEDIAISIEKSVRSVRSKLVREGVYKPQEKKTVAKKDGPSKKELLQELDQLAPFEVDGFMGATKDAIADLIAYINQQ